MTQPTIDHDAAIDAMHAATEMDRAPYEPDIDPDQPPVPPLPDPVVRAETVAELVRLQGVVSA